MGFIKRAIQRLHIRVGDALGLTRFNSCTECVWYKSLGANGLCRHPHAGQDKSSAVTKPCEAVWCECFDRSKA